MRTYYQILRVGEKASAEEIKAAFKRLAVMYHPDRNPDNARAEEQFKLVNEAYQTLSDSQKKFIYDQRLYAQKSTHTYSGGAYQGMGGGYMRGSRGRRASWRQGGRYQQPNMRHGAPKASARPVYDPKADQWQGVVGALGFVGSVALVVSLCIALYTAMVRIEQNRVHIEQVEFLAKVRKHHQADSIFHQLQIIDKQIASEDGYNVALSDFRTALVNEMKSQATSLYKREHYKQALRYLNVWRQRIPEDAKWLDPQIFQCYKNLNLMNEATEVMQKIRARGESQLFVYSELGNLYHNHHRQPELALNYYDTASMHIIKGYKEDHGDAYALMIDPATQSETQYEVFIAKAQLEYETGQYAKAKASASWAHVLRPSKIPPIHYKASACMAMGNQAGACNTWRDAMAIGHIYFLDSVTKYNCQPR